MPWFVLGLLKDHILQGMGSKLDEDGCLTRKSWSAAGRAQLLHTGFWGTVLQSLWIIEDKPTTTGGSSASPFKYSSHSLHWPQLEPRLSRGGLAQHQAQHQAHRSLATWLSQLRQRTLTFTLSMGKEGSLHSQAPSVLQETQHLS